MRYDTCRQCVRRRIQCDKQSPECAKCLKKGLTCSGVGKQYHFVQGIGRKQQSTRLRSFSTSTVKCTETGNGTKDNSVAAEGIWSFAEARNDDLVLKGRIVPYISQDLAATTICLANSSLQTIDADKRMMFDYFSSMVAPAMVVFDVGTGNGYRNLLLPLAMEDELVRQAVSVCSAFHIGRKQPEILEQAERDRTAIIQRLRHDALHSPPEQTFSLSVWATIILLLVAETVTGEHEFNYLFKMLQSVVKNTAATSTDPEVSLFLIQQTQMFNLFTPLFLGPEVGLVALRDVEAYMDFIPPGEEQDACHVSTALKQSICLARDMYLARVNDTNVDIEPLVEKLVLLVVSINEQPGMHAFVWPYFIAAATTRNTGYRSIFISKLRQIYIKTGMRNILASISMLEKLWGLRPDQNWTKCRSILQQTLVM